MILLMQLNNSTKLIFFGPKRRLSDILWNQDELLLVSSLTKSAYDWNLTRATFFFCCKTNFYQVSSFKDRFFRLPLHLKPRLKFSWNYRRTGAKTPFKKFEHLLDIKKGKLCGSSKFAKNRLLQIKLDTWWCSL